MPTDSTNFDLDMVNFGQYIRPIISNVGLNCKIDKWIYNLTEQESLMVTAVVCRDARNFYPEEAVLTETFFEYTEFTLDLIRNLSRFTELQWANILI